MRGGSRGSDPAPLSCFAFATPPCGRQPAALSYLWQATDEVPRRRSQHPGGGGGGGGGSGTSGTSGTSGGGGSGGSLFAQAQAAAAAAAAADDGVWSAASRAAAAKVQTWTSGHGDKGDEAGSSRRRQHPGAEGGVVAAASELHVVGRVVYLYRARGVYRAALLPPRLEGDGRCVAGGTLVGPDCRRYLEHYEDILLLVKAAIIENEGAGIGERRPRRSTTGTVLC